MSDTLEDRIASLQAEIKAYSSDIVNYVQSLYSPNSYEVDLRNDPRNILKVRDIVWFLFV